MTVHFFIRRACIWPILVVVLLGWPLRADRVDDAVQRGVKFLVRHQDSRTGSFSLKNSKTRPVVSNESYPMAALSVMAMASVGHQPVDDSEAGRAMSKGVEFLIRDDPRRNRSGGYYGVDGSRMYGHGITTLCLGEMLGMSVTRDQDRRIRQNLVRAVNLILAAQRQRKPDSRHVGGWRYEPTSSDSDLSITVWQLMALRSAQNAGLPVRKENIDLAVKYLKRSYQSARNARGHPTNLKTGFGYTPTSRPRYASTAAGLLSLQVCNLDEEEAPEIIGAANYLEDIELNPKRLLWFYYGTYYYAQGMQRRKNDKPDSDGSRQARKARENVERVLLNLQKADGSWEGSNRTEMDIGKIYCTTLAILSLSVKHHFLPIYQH